VIAQLVGKGELEVIRLPIPEELKETLLTGGRRCMCCGHAFFGESCAKGVVRCPSGVFGGILFDAAYCSAACLARKWKAGGEGVKERNGFTLL